LFDLLSQVDDVDQAAAGHGEEDREEHDIGGGPGQNGHRRPTGQAEALKGGFGGVETHAGSSILAQLNAAAPVSSCFCIASIWRQAETPGAIQMATMTP